ncbi:MAG: Fic family protein [Actinomycetota bacterium]
MNSESRKRRGRPSLEDLLLLLDEEVGLAYARLGGLPRAVEADLVLRQVWIDDVHNSTAIEGNTLTRVQVERIIETRMVAGQASLSESLDVEGYARAADWVYRNAGEHKGVPVRIVSEIHRLALGLVWEVEPPPTRDRPGAWRLGGVRLGAVKVSLPSAILADLTEWSRSTAAVEHHPVVHAAIHHAWFGRIHPFVDGNGRVGRLIMNFMLLQAGYPPAVIPVADRRRYLRAIQATDRGNVGTLSALVARSARQTLTRFLIPNLAGRAKLVPLSALAEVGPYSSAYLRQLAISGRLRTVREGRPYLSSKAWLDDYIRTRDPRGGQPGGRRSRG